MKSLLVVIIVYFFTACSPEGLNDLSIKAADVNISTGSDFNLTGAVIDGAISGATVCIDLNIDGVCGSDEPVSVTSSSGVFTFSNVHIAINSLLSIIAIDGVDTVTGKNLNGEFKNIVDATTFSGTENLFVTPLTDLIATDYLNSSVSSSANIANSVDKIAIAYNISTDYIDANPSLFAGIFFGTQSIQQTIGLLEVAIIKSQGISPTVDERKTIKRNIKEAIVQQITEDVNINIENVLIKLEANLGITFLENEKLFLVEQLQKILADISSFSIQSNLTTANLNTYQLALENRADEIYTFYNNADGVTTISSLDINIDIFQTVVDSNTTVVDTNLTNISFDGLIVDGYISGATICLDIDYSGVCDSNEPFVSSDEKGIFHFSGISVQKDVMLPVIGFGGVDTTLAKLYNWELKTIISTADSALSTLVVVSPLTDLVSIDFLSKTVYDADNYDVSLSKVALSLSMTTQTIQQDPMQDVSLFGLTQNLEYIKKMTEILTISRSSLEVKSLQNEIKKQLLAQIVESGYENLLRQRVLTATEVNLDIQIPDFEKIYYETQLEEIQRVLDLLTTSQDIYTYTLPNIQRAINDIVETTYTNKIKQDINITVESITKSQFDKIDAIYDIDGCLLTDIFKNVIADSSASSERVNDIANGLSIYSDFNISSTIFDSQVTLFYPDLNTTKQSENIVVFEDKFYFAYDRAWVDTNQTIYIQTPKDIDSLYSCYRAKLDSDIAANIKLTKVYRYE